jgi:hypothetical protein
MAEIDTLQVQIAAGQSLSPQIDIGTKSLVALVLPSNWVAAAGGISFQASIDGGTTWNELLTLAGTPYAISFTAAGAAYLALSPDILRGVQSLKIRSGTSASPVPQTNTVVLQLVTRLAL